MRLLIYVALMSLATHALAKNIIEGNLNNFEDKSIIIGSRLATFLRVKVNDKIELISSTKSTTPFGNIPSVIKLDVVGIFDVGMYNIDRNVIFMPKYLATKLLNKDQNYISHLEIFVRDIDYVNETAYEINENFGDIHKIYTWESMHKQLFNALKVEKKVMFLILSLIVFVAAFNLISSIIMIVKDKERGIGILRSLGCTRDQILRIFIFIGSIVGILGTIIGTISCSYAAIICHMIKPLSRMSGRSNRTNRFTRSVITMLAHYRMKYNF